MTDLSLSTQLRLQDIRLRVLNREPVTADEYHHLIADLRQDRESSARASAAAKRAERKASSSSSAKQTPTFDLATMFGPKAAS